MDELVDELASIIKHSLRLVLPIGQLPDNLDCERAKRGITRPVVQATLFRHQAPPKRGTLS